MARTVQLVFFYKLEGVATSTIDRIADEADLVFITKNDEPERVTFLASADYRGQSLEYYVNGWGLHNRTGPGIYVNGQVNLAIGTAAMADNVGTSLKNNHLFWKRNSQNPSGKEDLLETRDNIKAVDSNDWFLRRVGGAEDGLVAVSGGNYPDNAYHDITHPGLLAYLNERTTEWILPRGDGKFGDNLSTQINFLSGSAQTSTIGAGDSPEARAAIRAYIDHQMAYAQENVGANTGKTFKYTANIQRAAASDNDLLWWCEMVVLTDGSLSRRLDRVMLELSGGINYLGAYETPSRWNRYLIAQDYAVTHGVADLTIAQLSASTIASNPNGTEGTKGKYATATYLMGAGANSYFRISNSYGTTTLDLSIFEPFNALGAPTGRYTLAGGVYTREFQNGTLTVNPTTQTYSITPAEVVVSLLNPWITHQPNRNSVTGQAISLYITARSMYISGQTCQLTATGLPTGLSIDDVDGGGLITGTISSTANLRNDVVITAEDESLLTADTAFTWWIQPPDLAVIDTVPVRFNLGGVDVAPGGTDALTDDWLEDTVANAQAVRSTANTLEGTTGSTLTYDDSCPPWIPQSVLQSWIRDGTNIGYDFTGLTAGDYMLVLYFVNTGDAVGARQATVVIDGVDQETFDYNTATNGVANTAFARTYPFTRTTTGTTTLDVEKAGSSQVRLSAIELYSFGEVAGGTPTINPITDIETTVGNNTAYQVVAAIGGASGSLSYSATGLPPGRDINPVTGEITGVYQYNGATYRYPVTITVTQSPGGETASTSYVEWVKSGALFRKNNIPVRYQYKSTGTQAASDTDGETAAWVNDWTNATQADTTRDLSLSPAPSRTNTTTDPARGSSTPPWYNLNMLRNRIFRNQAEPSLRHTFTTASPIVILITWNTADDTTKEIDIEINGAEIERVNPYTLASNTADTTVTRAYLATPVSGEVVLEMNKVGSTVPAYYALEVFTVATPPVLTTIDPDTFTINEGASGTLFTASATDVETWGLSGDPVSDWLEIVDNEDGTADVVYTSAVAGEYVLTASASNTAGTDSQPFTLTVRELPEVLDFELASDDSIVTTLNLVEGNTAVIVNGYAIDPQTFADNYALSITPTPPSGGSFESTQVDANYAPDPYIVITFTPQAGDAGTYVYRFTITNTVGAPASYKELTINVALPAGDGMYIRRRRGRSRSR